MRASAIEVIVDESLERESRRVCEKYEKYQLWTGSASRYFIEAADGRSVSGLALVERSRFNRSGFWFRITTKTENWARDVGWKGLKVRIESPLYLTDLSSAHWMATRMHGIIVCELPCAALRTKRAEVRLDGPETIWVISPRKGGFRLSYRESDEKDAADFSIYSGAFA